jgi:dihydropteroate synthase
VTASVLAGARAVRVHDVAEMHDVVRVALAIREAARHPQSRSEAPLPRLGSIRWPSPP